MTDETAARLTTHEAVCAERYKNLGDTLTEVKAEVKGVKSTMWAVAGATILQLLAVISYLVTRIN